MLTTLPTLKSPFDKETRRHLARQVDGTQELSPDETEIIATRYPFVAVCARRRARVRRGATTRNRGLRRTANSALNRHAEITPAVAQVVENVSRTANNR
ncbi:MAG TPA: hypothetical protein VJA21_19425 [Verrucomicrobiae bacterium]